MVFVPLLVLLLFGMVIHNGFAEKTVPVNPMPKVRTSFLDGPFIFGGQEDPRVKNSQRIGFYLADVDDEKADPAVDPEGKKRLTFFTNGASNNVCVKIDGKESLVGSTPLGSWTKTTTSLGVAHDGPGGKSRKRIGRKSIFFYTDTKIEIAQIVEVRPDDQPTEVKYQGRKQEMRLLNTVLVRYEITNKDDKPHQVGIRFLLDTFIGTNDGVPFAIPGDKELCTTKKEMLSKNGGIPAYIEALENESLKAPGTIARLSLRIPGLEIPSRVTLGAWPHKSLQEVYPNLREKIQQHMTMWDVPLLSKRWKIANKEHADSAVTIYWTEKSLKPGAKRVVGFAYGLGNFSSSSGKIGLSTGGDFTPGGTIVIIAMVETPKEGQTATIHLPPGFKLAEGAHKQAVAKPRDLKVNRSLVTWKVTAPKKTGRFHVKVSTGKFEQSRTLVIAKKASILD
jgi:hypothetical protein